GPVCWTTDGFPLAKKHGVSPWTNPVPRNAYAGMTQLNIPSEFCTYSWKAPSSERPTESRNFQPCSSRLRYSSVSSSMLIGIASSRGTDVCFGRSRNGKNPVRLSFGTSSTPLKYHLPPCLQ